MLKAKFTFTAATPPHIRTRRVLFLGALLSLIKNASVVTADEESKCKEYCNECHNNSYNQAIRDNPKYK